MSNKLSQVTYTDDGSGFVAHVTYDGAIGPPAIPLNDSAIGSPAPIPFQEDQQDPPPEPLQPVVEPLPQDLDGIVVKGQEEEEEADAEDHPVHNMFFSQPPNQGGLPAAKAVVALVDVHVDEVLELLDLGEPLLGVVGQGQALQLALGVEAEQDGVKDIRVDQGARLVGVAVSLLGLVLWGMRVMSEMKISNL